MRAIPNALTLGGIVHGGRRIRNIYTSWSGLMELHLTACGRSFTNSTNINGPRMDPACVTPYLRVCEDEASGLFNTHSFDVFHLGMFRTTLLCFPQHQTRAAFLQQNFVVDCVKCLTKVTDADYHLFMADSSSSNSEEY